MTEFNFHTTEQTMQEWIKIENYLAQLDYPLKRIRQTRSLINSFIQLDYIADREKKQASIFLDQKNNIASIILKMKYSKGLEEFYIKYRHMLSWDRKEIKEFYKKMLTYHDGVSYTRNNPYEAIAVTIGDLHKMNVSKYIVSSEGAYTKIEIEYPIEEK